MLMGQTVPPEFQSGGVIEVAVLRGFESMDEQRTEMAQSYFAPALYEAKRCNCLKPYNAPPRFGCLISALALVGDEIHKDRQMKLLLDAATELHSRVEKGVWIKLPPHCQSALLGEAICRKLLDGQLDNRRRVASYQDSFCYDLSTEMAEISAHQNMATLTKKYGGYPSDEASRQDFHRELEMMGSIFPSFQELGVDYGGMGSKVEDQGYKFQ